MSAPREAVAYADDVRALDRQVAVAVLRLWRRIDPRDVSASWLALLPEALAAVAAAQVVAAEMADPYTETVTGGAAAAYVVDPEAFAGRAADGRDLSSLLYLPVVDAKQKIGAGLGAAEALRLAQFPLSMYVQTSTADAARQSAAAAIGARPSIAGYYRMLNLPSCSRCAILAGKWFEWNRGFRRHPRCDCVHIPAREADDVRALDPREAIESGKVTGLSKVERKAIDLGADPAAVVNARRGMSTLSRGLRYTTEGTTRHGVAGARILARDAERAAGGVGAVAGRTFTNLTFPRDVALRYRELFTKGKTFTRQTKTGRTQSYAFRFARSPRPTVDTILSRAPSRDEAIRQLINNGYIIFPSPEQLAAAARVGARA